MSAATDRILPPYTRRVDDGITRVRRAAVLMAVALYAVFMGLALVLLPITAIIIPLAPVLFLAVLAIWVLPDADVDTSQTFRKLLFPFLLIQMVWPQYMAINLPGLPWISPGRVAMVMMLLVAAYGFGQSSRMRATAIERWSATPWLGRLFVGFLVIQVLTLPFSRSLEGALKTFFLAQGYHTFVAVVAAFVLAMPGAALTLRRVMGIGALVVAGLMIPEVNAEAPVWGPYIPEWLKGDPELVARALSPQSRAADGLYRARSIFTVALNCAEYLGMVMPFVLHNLVNSKTVLRRLGMAGVWLLVFAGMWFTNNRTALVTLLASHVIYGVWWTVRRLRRSRGTRDLVGPSVMLLYPAAAIAFLTLILSSRRAYIRIIGGGQHQASNDAREGQYAVMWDRLAANPFGYGSGQAGNVVGWVGARDTLTLDSYVINILVDFGVVGFVLYVAMFFVAIWTAGQVYLRSDNANDDVALPVSVCMCSFLLAKLVQSWDGNVYLAFLMIGTTVGLAWRQRQNQSGASPGTGLARA